MSEFKPSNNSLKDTVTVDGKLSVSSIDASETAFNVSIPGQENMFCIDASSSLDGKPRITIKTNNEHAGNDLEVPIGVDEDTPRGMSRGLLHIERGEASHLNTLSAWSYGTSPADISRFELASWSSSLTNCSGISLLSSHQINTSNFRAVVLDGKTLGRIGYGGYSHNQPRPNQAYVDARATQNWNYSSKCGSKLVLGTTPNDSSTPADHLTISSDGAYIHAPPSAPPSADMNNSTVSMHVDEALNKLTFTVKYSDGTVKTGTVNLT